MSVHKRVPAVSRGRATVSAASLILLIAISGSIKAWSARSPAHEDVSHAAGDATRAVTSPPATREAEPERVAEGKANGAQAHTSTASPQQGAQSQSAAVEGRVEAEVVVATAFGFEPGEISRPAGQFILAVHNRTGEAALSLRLDRVRGDKLKEVRLLRGRRAKHQELNLPAGEYLLSVSEHPERNCRITMTQE